MSIMNSLNSVLLEGTLSPLGIMRDRNNGAMFTLEVTRDGYRHPVQVRVREGALVERLLREGSSYTAETTLRIVGRIGWWGLGDKMFVWAEHCEVAKTTRPEGLSLEDALY